MKINSNYSINFTAKKNVLNSEAIKNTKKYTFAKSPNELYGDIDKFLSKKYTNEQYLTVFMEKVNSNAYNEDSNVEKKYVNDILTSIDLNRSYKDIPDEYLKVKMLKLLDSKK